MKEKINKDQLFFKYKNIVYFILKKYNLLKYQDELFDLGYIGLLKGIEKYDAKKNISMSTCIYRYIQAEIFSYLIKTLPKDYMTISLDSLDLDTNYEEVFESKYNVEEEFKFNHIVQSIKECLQYDMNYKQHREIIIDLFFSNKKMLVKDIAKKYNVSVKTIENVKDKFRKKLKERLKFIL